MSEKLDQIIEGYNRYTEPAEIQRDAAHNSELGNIGTSISLSVTYSASVTFTVTWSA